MKKLTKLFARLLLIAYYLLLTIYLPAGTAYATYDPLSTPNNKFGIHVISATPDETSPAKDLVNLNGDWGYITILVESKDRNHDKWQAFFNDLRRKHLIPIIRLATAPEGNFWKKPFRPSIGLWTVL